MINPKTMNVVNIWGGNFFNSYLQDQICLKWYYFKTHNKGFFQPKEQQSFVIDEGFYYVVLDDPELIVYIRLTSNSQRSGHFCSPLSLGLKVCATIPAPLQTSWKAFFFFFFLFQPPRIMFSGRWELAIIHRSWHEVSITIYRDGFIMSNKFLYPLCQEY